MGRWVGLVNLWLRDEQAQRMRVTGRDQSFEVRGFGLVVGVVQTDFVPVRRGIGTLAGVVQGWDFVVLVKFGREEDPVVV
jgi:hypothetical protein